MKDGSELGVVSVGWEFETWEKSWGGVGREEFDVGC